MGTINTPAQNGDLLISVSVVEKIAKFAALDVEGVKDVSVGSTGVKGILSKTTLPKAVEVTVDADGVAEIKINVIAETGYKAPVIARNVQESVKSNVQSMTDITVSKVHVVFTGVESKEEL